MTFRSGRRNYRQTLWLTGLLIASVILLLPSFLDELSALNQAELIGRYRAEMEARSRDVLMKERERAFKYNRQVIEAQKTRPFSYRGDSGYDADYLQLLGGAGGIMGYLEIPSLDLYLPVYHGTSAEVLKNAAGHIYGSSLPVGGPGSHAVIAAHSGLRHAELFSGLVGVQEGDIFYMHVLGEMHAYEVCEINTVYPAEEDPYLQVEDGEDLITLYTCTPSGINDHRLLVRGRRTADPPPNQTADSADGTARRKRKALFLLILIAAVPPLLILMTKGTGTFVTS